MLAQFPSKRVADLFPCRTAGIFFAAALLAASPCRGDRADLWVWGGEVEAASMKASMRAAGVGTVRRYLPFRQSFRQTPERVARLEEGTGGPRNRGDGPSGLPGRGSFRNALVQGLWTLGSDTSTLSVNHVMEKYPQAVYGPSIGAFRYSVFSAFWVRELLEEGSTLLPGDPFPSAVHSYRFQTP